MSGKLRISGPPKSFHGRISLPPSKSYVHRALFVASLAKKPSILTNCGSKLADDILASVGTLRAFGCKVRSNKEQNGSLEVVPGQTRKSKITIYAKGSGTTARFAIAYAALAREGSVVEISGDASLSMRPMQIISESLEQLGVECSYTGKRGKLPIAIKGGGIPGGDCSIDGSISSQFISSLLISCTKAKKDCVIRIENPGSVVSKPYIDSTIAVLSYFGLKVEALPNSAGYKVKGNQTAQDRIFQVPGDMSAGATMICATLAASGNSDLIGVNPKFHQPDESVIRIARKLGADLEEIGKTIRVRRTAWLSRTLDLDLNRSPDLVPAVAGLAAARGLDIKISNIGHLRYKESDRISVIARGLRKLGIRIAEKKDSLRIDASGVSKPFRKPILMDSERDHRMLMAFAIAGLSGRYGEVLVSDPDCVSKSYPDFVKDLQGLCHEKKTLRIVE